jgi:hypothetical protein
MPCSRKRCEIAEDFCGLLAQRLKRLLRFSQKSFTGHGLCIAFCDHGTGEAQIPFHSASALVLALVNSSMSPRRIATRSTHQPTPIAATSVSQNRSRIENRSFIFATNRASRARFLTSLHIGASEDGQEHHFSQLDRLLIRL